MCTIQHKHVLPSLHKVHSPFPSPLPDPHPSSLTGPGPTGSTMPSIHRMRTLSVLVPSPSAM